MHVFASNTLLYIHMVPHIHTWDIYDRHQEIQLYHMQAHVVSKRREYCALIYYANTLF